MKLVIFFAACLFFVSAQGQELFPLMEPASTLPKNTLGVRLMDEAYREPGNQYRSQTALRIMYGVLPKLSVYVSADASNHHNPILPPDFPAHNTPQIGVPHPFLFNGFDLYAKYRLYSRDGENKHFRIAVYGEFSAIHTAHDEAEPTLLDDTRGYAAGFIATYLVERFAISFTGGAIVPFQYTGGVTDPSGLPSVPAKVQYGKAENYDLSLGYLLFPKNYTSYKQTNINLYLEFLGKSYDAAEVQFSNYLYSIPFYEVSLSRVPALLAGHYVEVDPGVQCIFNSNTRAELSVGFPFINKSYVHYYPLYTVGVQHYFYLGKKK